MLLKRLDFLIVDFGRRAVGFGDRFGFFLLFGKCSCFRLGFFKGGFQLLVGTLGFFGLWRGGFQCGLGFLDGGGVGLLRDQTGVEELAELIDFLAVNLERGALRI